MVMEYSLPHRIFWEIPGLPVAAATSEHVNIATPQEGEKVRLL
jgi:hypothetical protein